MNFLRKFIGASAVDEVALIPSGKLFLARSPLLPKGALECLYNDAYITIKQTTTQFLYQLVVIRAYQEGEEEKTDEADEDDDSEGTALDVGINDERVFFLADDLKVRVYTKDSGSRVIAWKDLNGDYGDLFEFVVDEDIKYNEVDHFMTSLHRCLYELKYQKPSVGVDDDMLAEFVYDPKSASEDDADLALRGLKDLRNISYEYGNAADEEEEDEEDEVASDDHEFADALNIPYHLFSPSLKVEGDDVYAGHAKLRVFDPDADSFVLIAERIHFKIINTKDTGFCLVSDTERYSFCFALSQELNPAFNFEHNVFIFNVYSLKGNSEQITAYSLMLKFTDFKQLDDFQSVFFKAMYSAVVENSKLLKESDDMDYVTDAFGRLEVEEGESSETDYDDYVDADDGLDDEGGEAIHKIIQRGVKSKLSRPSGLFVSANSDDEYDDEEDANQERRFLSSNYKNSQLAVGQANDRSYVTRGDTLGVYKRGGDDGLGFLTVISGLKDLKGDRLLAKKTLLHQRDNTLLLTKDDPTDTKIYKMDLGRGAVVEEWDADDKEQLADFAHVSKFAGLTNEQLLNGISSNSMFRIDPRLSGKKVVKDKTFKAYKTKNNGFETMTVTDQGFVAVGLKEGNIRLYDKVGLNAKVLLPALGQSFVGLDVTKDGRWLLATCKTYLLLIDLKIGKGQKNAGAIGFEKYFDADKKPVPKRLALRPEHFTQLAQASNSLSLNFTKAVFNSLLDTKETSIVTSTGPFVILWSLTNIAKNWKREPTYKILRYSQDVVADSFLFDSQNDMVTVLKDDVSVVNKSGFTRAANSMTAR